MNPKWLSATSHQPKLTYAAGGAHLSSGGEYVRQGPNQRIAVHICHDEWLSYMMGGIVDRWVCFHNFSLSHWCQAGHCGPYKVTIPISIPRRRNWVASATYDIFQNLIVSLGLRNASTRVKAMRSTSLSSSTVQCAGNGTCISSPRSSARNFFCRYSSNCIVVCRSPMSGWVSVLVMVEWGRMSDSLL